MKDVETNRLASSSFTGLSASVQKASESTNPVGFAHSFQEKNQVLAYCSTLANRYPPSFSSDGQPYSLDALFKARIGRTFSNEDKQRAQESLAHLLPTERIDEVIGKIEKARNDQDGIWAVDYGPALAVVGALDLPETTKKPEDMKTS